MAVRISLTILLSLSLVSSSAGRVGAAEAAGPAGLHDRRAGRAPVACDDASGVAILAVPRSPSAGQPLRVLASSAASLDARLVVHGPDGSVMAASAAFPEAAPSASESRRWLAEIASPLAGVYRATLESGGRPIACAEIRVSPSPLPPRQRSAGAVWPVEREWDRGTESLYSTWIERLFDDPLDADPSWRGLGEILGDRDRNLLHDHLGLDEDEPGRMSLEPDCADLPFFLRAYFAWKLGLPFGYSECSRGGGATAPRCVAWHTNLEPPPDGAAGDVEAFRRFLTRDVGWTVHSGSARTLLADDRTDLYPTRIAPDAITPGAVYADPYGHTLLVVRRLPQTDVAGGILLAVDAQPDRSVARKRYWRGNFLFAVDPRLGGAGFKHFRPAVRDGDGLRPLTNREIAADPAYGDFSIEQDAEGVEGFYDRMDDLLSPAPLDPARALRETIDALDEQTRTRVRSVDNGEAYVAAHPGLVSMPVGPAIFETTGAWEDYATPSRDLRLLIATDVVRGFPDRVARRPERYAIPEGRSTESVRSELEAMLARELASRRITYRRSDGSEWTLTLADLLERARALEIAYNPNDCVEVRWGAGPSSAEASTCRRRAPRDQTARMEGYRAWFAERRRPPRA